MSKKEFAAGCGCSLVLVALLVLGGWFLFSTCTSQPTTPNVTSTPIPSELSSEDLMGIVEDCLSLTRVWHGMTEEGFSHEQILIAMADELESSPMKVNEVLQGCAEVWQEIVENEN